MDQHGKLLPGEMKQIYFKSALPNQFIEVIFPALASGE
jgi:hypothetical protein